MTMTPEQIKTLKSRFLTRLTEIAPTEWTEEESSLISIICNEGEIDVRAAISATTPRPLLRSVR